MIKKSLLDKAIGLYNLTIKFDYNDECQFDYVAFNIQQIIELCIKYRIENKGVRYPLTHDLNLLKNICDDEYINLNLSEEEAFRYTRWEAKSRYNTNFLVSVNELKDTLCKAKLIIDYMKTYVGQTREF